MGHQACTGGAWNPIDGCVGHISSPLHLRHLPSLKFCSIFYNAPDLILLSLLGTVTSSAHKVQIQRVLRRVDVTSRIRGETEAGDGGEMDAGEAEGAGGGDGAEEGDES
jgi:hypothetical protein